MEFVIFWIICGGVAAMITSSKGGSGGIGFLVGLLLGPIGIIIALFMGSDAGKVEKQVSTGQMKQCPRCAEAVLPAAKVCKHCQHEFDYDWLGEAMAKLRRDGEGSGNAVPILRTRFRWRTDQQS